jgi:hypothetical protein
VRQGDEHGELTSSSMQHRSLPSNGLCISSSKRKQEPAGHATTGKCTDGTMCCACAPHCCRYAGTDVAVMTRWQEGADPAAAFAASYQREFGFVLERPVVVDDVRVRATGRAADLPDVAVSEASFIAYECMHEVNKVCLWGGRSDRGAC